MIKLGNYFEICVVTYNRIELVSACLSSIINYTKLPYKLIVCDNYSTDGTREYLKLLEKKKLIHKLILNDTNLGIAESKNQLVDSLTWESDFFVLTDSDIVFPYTVPGWIEQMIDVMNHHPKLGTLNLNFDAVNVAQDTIWWFEKQNELHRQKKDDLLLLEAGFWGSLIPRSTIELLNTFNKIHYDDPKPFRCKSLYGETDEMFRSSIQKLDRWCGIAKNLIGLNLGWDDSKKFQNYHMFKKIERSKAENLRKHEGS